MVGAAISSVLASGRISGRLGRGLQAGLAGVWLGVLDEAQLRALDQRYYERDGTYRTAAWNDSGLSGWEREAVDANLVPGSRIVVPACGGGREVLALLAGGFDAVGYESHPALSAYAAELLAQRGHPGRVHPAARDVFPDCGPCDGVLVGWGAYSLITPGSARVTFLRGAAAVTAGPIVLSCFQTSEHGRGARLTTRLANTIRRRRGTVAVEAGDTLAPNRVHVFTREELARELGAAGLALESVRAVSADPGPVGYVCAVGRAR